MGFEGKWPHSMFPLLSVSCVIQCDLSSSSSRYLLPCWPAVVDLCMDLEPIKSPQGALSHGILSHQQKVTNITPFGGIPHRPLAFLFSDSILLWLALSVLAGLENTVLTVSEREKRALV